MAENKCDFCGKYEMLPFNCKFCGGTFCATHRLPEYHDCPGLRTIKNGTWKPPVSGRKAPAGAQRKGRIKVPAIRLPGRGLYAYAIIVICILVFVLQSVAPAVTDQFTLTSASLLARPWTLITYMFLHANIMHIFFNLLVLFFFGPLLERQIGSARFLGLYLGSGILAGVAQVLIFPGSGVIGASAAIFGVMGALAVLMPDLRVYVYFIPMKILYAVILFALLDIVLIPSGDMVAHTAHLVGLAAGLLYGYLIRKRKGAVQTLWHA